MTTIIPIFYEKILRSLRLKEFFRGVDMSRQIQKYQGFLSVCLGDTTTWGGKSLREIHLKLKITDKDYWDFM